MSYLYGDSTPSNLQLDFIDFLRDAIDFCVQALMVEQRSADGRARVKTLEEAARTEEELLRQLEASLALAVQGPARSGEADSATARCAAAIVRSASEIVGAEVAGARAAIAAESSKLEAHAAHDRERCLRALESLLVKHDLPETTFALHLALTGGTGYRGHVLLKAGFGLEAKLEVDIPAGHLFGQLVRLDRIVERLEVQAPEMTGWLHKEVKQKPQRLERHHVTELLFAGANTDLKLRAVAEGQGPGFDVTFRDEAPRFSLVRIDDHGAPAGPPFEATLADAEKLLAVRDKLSAATADLISHRKVLLGATIDGEPLGVDQRPSLLVDRLIASMAPVVQEIAARSQSSGELVLRRLLGDDRREEVFVSKAELQRKLDPLSESTRAVFAPLWHDRRPGAAAEPSRRLPPRPTRGTPAFGSPIPAPAPLVPAPMPPAPVPDASSAAGPPEPIGATAPEPAR